MSEIRRGAAPLKHVNAPSEAKGGSEGGGEGGGEVGGFASSLAAIRSGAVKLKHVSRPSQLQREPSGSLASILRSRLATRQQAMGTDDGDDDDEPWE